MPNIIEARGGGEQVVSSDLTGSVLSLPGLV